jgi:hypothetical protein
MKCTRMRELRELVGREQHSRLLGRGGGVEHRNTKKKKRRPMEGLTMRGATYTGPDMMAVSSVVLCFGWGYLDDDGEEEEGDE